VVNAYQTWVLQHTPEQINQANAARAQLVRIAKSEKGPHIPRALLQKIKDDRQVKKPRTAYNIFFTERARSGDFKGIHAREYAKLIGGEWHSLSEAEKKVRDPRWQMQ